MNKRVIITDLLIKSLGQIRNFQVKIPHDAIRIMGANVTVTMGATVAVLNAFQAFYAQSSNSLPNPNQSSNTQSANSLLSPNLLWMAFTPNIFLGDLRMQSCGKANVFISEDVYMEDDNIEFGDFSAIPQFMPTDWTNKVKSEMVEVSEEGDITVLKGIYRDRQSAGGSFPYSVGVYIWYEIPPLKP